MFWYIINWYLPITCSTFRTVFLPQFVVLIIRSYNTQRHIACRTYANCPVLPLPRGTHPTPARQPFP
jgi:hypothetical protein